MTGTGEPGCGAPHALPRVAVVLVHAPVYNRCREVVATSVTGSDIHDIARVALTFAATPYYIVSPVEAQRDLVERVARYWIEGEGHRVDHPRGEAIGTIRIVPSLGDAVAASTEDWGHRPDVVRYAAGSPAGTFTSNGTIQNRQWLWEKMIQPWKDAESHGIGVMVGEFGSFNKTPHDVTLRWMEDCLANWRQAGWGWALWNFRGSFGNLDSGRSDVDYEDWEGHKLDRKMLELLQRY